MKQNKSIKWLVIKFGMGLITVFSLILFALFLLFLLFLFASYIFSIELGSISDWQSLSCFFICLYVSVGIHLLAIKMCSKKYPKFDKFWNKTMKGESFEDFCNRKNIDITH